MAGGYQTILAGTNNEEKLKSFWLQFFPELPKCKEPGCQHIAMEVDTFFPYLDDNNRCYLHLSLDKAKQIAPQNSCRQKALNGRTTRAPKKASLWRAPGNYHRNKIQEGAFR